MAIFATTGAEIRFVEFDLLDSDTGNVTVSFDGERFTFAANRGEPAEPLRPEYDRFIEKIVAGDGFDADDEQNAAAAEQVAALGIMKASAYAEVCWATEAARES